MEHDGLRSRKLIATAVCYLTATALVVAGTLTGDQWADLMPWLLGIYCGGNVGERIAGRQGSAGG